MQQCYVVGAVDLVTAIALRPDVGSWATCYSPDASGNGVVVFDSATTQNLWLTNS